MARVLHMQTAFNGGELSPFMLGRPDHDIWAIAVAEMVGWAPRPQGPAEAMPGFEFIEEAEAEPRLIPFEPYVTQGYVVELTPLKLRFYTNDVLLTSGGYPVEVAAPWTADQIAELDYEQSNDVLYLFHPDVSTRQLVRTAADAFTLEEVAFENGPYLPRNDDESLTLSFNGVTGSVTCTASAALFAATDIGRFIEVEANDLSDIPMWEPGFTVSLNDLLQWDGRVYQVTGGGSEMRTGTVAPEHTRGTEWDGIGQGTDINSTNAGGVQLTYLYDRYGRATITAYTSATQVTATVTRHLPSQLATAYDTSSYIPGWYTPDAGYTGGSYTPPGSPGSSSSGTWRWRLGAFSDTTGWPAHGAIWNQRLCLAKDDRVYGSVAGDLTDFDRLNEYGDISLDQAFDIQLDNPNPIRWLLSSAELFIGTAISEHVLRAASAAEGVGPGNLRVERQSRAGSANLRPEELDGRPIFMQRNRHRLLHLVDDGYSRYVPDDLTRYADHIAASPFVELTRQCEPLQLQWAVREDGTLACADYEPQEKVLGWCRRELGGGMLAKSVCAITSPDGLVDQLWMAAEKDGAWFVMLMAPWRNADEDVDNAIMLDAALTYDGDPTDTLSMPHLAGETVQVVGDGLWLGEFDVASDGSIALDREVSTAMAGLPYTARMTFVSPEKGGDNGPAQFRMKRFSRVMLRLQKSLGLAVIQPNGDQVNFERTFPDTDWLSPLPAYSGDDELDVVGEHDRTGQITIERTAPFPATLLAFGGFVDVSER